MKQNIIVFDILEQKEFSNHGTDHYELGLLVPSLNKGIGISRRYTSIFGMGGHYENYDIIKYEQIPFSLPRRIV